MNDHEKLERLAALHKVAEQTEVRKRREQTYNASKNLDQSEMDAWFSEKWCPEFCTESFDRIVTYNGKIVYKLIDGCIFDRNHKDASVIIMTDGKICYNCFHNSCADKHWSDFRQHFEPAIRSMKSRAWEGSVKNAE